MPSHRLHPPYTSHHYHVVYFPSLLLLLPPPPPSPPSPALTLTHNDNTQMKQRTGAVKAYKNRTEQQWEEIIEIVDVVTEPVAAEGEQHDLENGADAGG